MAERPSRRLARPLDGDLAYAYDAVSEELAANPVDVVLAAARQAAAEVWAEDGAGDDEDHEVIADLLVTLAVEQAARQRGAEVDRG